MYTFKTVIAFACAATLGACGTYTRDAHLQSIQQEVADRTSFSLERAQDTQPAQPLSGILSHQDVVEAALRYNPKLQAAIEDLNVATAAEVQAGLLINPTFQGEFVFPGGGARPILDFMLALDVNRIVTRGRRVKIAQGEREAIQAMVTTEIVKTIAAAQSALLQLWQAEAMLRLYDEQLVIAEAGVKTAQLLYDAGNLTDGMLAQYYGARDLARVEKTRASLMVLNAREALASTTGTPISTNVSAASDTRAIMLDIEEATFVERTIDANLRLQAERQQIEALGARLNLAKISAWVEHLELEAVYEREDDGDGTGFSVTVPIPLFDWGQVRSGQAQAMLDAASFRYKAAFLNTSNRATALYQYYQSLKSAEARMSGAYIDNADRAYAFEESQLNAMQIGPLGLLRARASLIKKQMQTLNIQYQYAMAAMIANAMLTGVLLNAVDGMSAMDTDMSLMANDEGAH